MKKRSAEAPDFKMYKKMREALLSGALSLFPMEFELGQIVKSDAIELTLSAVKGKIRKTLKRRRIARRKPAFQNAKGVPGA